VSVKESVFPFNKFPGVDTILGPEMKSTGEVMGIATDVAVAFGKSQLATGSKMPKSGSAFVSVNDDDKIAACHVARRLRNLGFRIVATRGTAEVFAKARIPCDIVHKVAEGSPHSVDKIRAGEIHLVVNTTQGTKAIRDSYAIRRSALLAGVPYFTTMSAALAAVASLEAAALGGGVAHVRSVQEWHTRGR
jgi:carbamoyl-phosphate synthase large subunit